MARASKSPPPPPLPRVLIVDDDERNAFAASEALEILNCELVVARSGEEALRLLLGDEFAVILLDLHMPGMDGYETARLIREHPRTRDTPIVFVTAVFRDEAHIFQAYTVGAVDVVFKPVDPFILRSKVAVLVELFKKTHEVRRQGEERHRLLRENARITEARLAAELALRQARERQDAILRSLPVVFTSRATVHPFGALFVSDSITPLTGFHPNRFVDEPEIGLGRIHPDDIEIVVDCLIKASEVGAYACEYRWMCSDGSYRRFLDQGVWVPDEGGGAGEIVGTLLDVTDQRGLEEELAQARKLEAVGRLTGGVAHDFNNLLTVVLGNADILLKRTTDERSSRQLGAIRAAADRGQALTRQLLAFSRRQQLQPEPVDLNLLIQRFAPLLRQAIGEGIDLDLELERRAVHVFVDPAHLENAILNLAVNARDAMTRRGRLTIGTDLHPVDPVARLRVTDTGSGISPEVAQRIFEPFYTTKDVGKGTGLGLSQVHGFVNQSGGGISVISASGEGATFELTLPLSVEPPEIPVARPDATQAPRGSERVLVVEDDPAVLSACLDMLSGLGYQVDVAIDGAGALSRLQSTVDYAVLFSDVMMPGGLTGIDLARQAKRLHPNLKIVLTSGYLGEAGMPDDHGFLLLTKPYDQQALARCIRESLDDGAIEEVSPVPAG